MVLSEEGEQEEKESQDHHGALERERDLRTSPRGSEGPAAIAPKHVFAVEPVEDDTGIAARRAGRSVKQGHFGQKVSLEPACGSAAPFQAGGEILAASSRGRVARARPARFRVFRHFSAPIPARLRGQ
jgi:hypothetical protein